MVPLRLFCARPDGFLSPRGEEEEELRGEMETKGGPRTEWPFSSSSVSSLPTLLEPPPGSLALLFQRGLCGSLRVYYTRSWLNSTVSVDTHMFSLKEPHVEAGGGKNDTVKDIRLENKVAETKRKRKTVTFCMTTFVV